MKLSNLFNRFKGKTKNESTGYKYYMLANNDFVATEFSDPKLALEGYIQNIIVYRCISLIADNVSLLNYRHHKIKAYGELGDEIKDSQLLKLLRNPFYQKSKSDFIREVISYKKIYGNSYIEKRFAERGGPYNPGKPLFLSPLRPDFMSLTNGSNQMNNLIRYTAEYDGIINFPVNVEGNSNLIHIKEFNPRSYYHGLSPIVPAAYNVDLHNQSAIHNNALLKNGATPSGFLKVPKETKLSPEQITRLKADIKDKLSHAKNSGKTLLLEGGMEFQQASVNSKDGEFQEMENNAAHKIGAAFNVPVDLIGALQAKYDNLKAAKDIFYDDAIIPEAAQYIDALNRNLTPQFDPNSILVADFDHTPVMLDRKISLMEKLNNISFITDNEKRSKVGLEPIDGGDELKKSMLTLPPEQNAFIEKEIASGSTLTEAIKQAELIYSGK